MRATSGVGCAILILAGLLAAQDNGPESAYESVLKEILAATDQMTTVLTGVRDEESAAAARPDLKKAATRFLEIRKKAEGLKQPNQEERDRVTKAYQGKLAGALTRLKQEVSRVQSIPGGEETLKEIAGLDAPPKK